MDFKNKVAIITGAAQGIGFEICRQLADHGAIVYLNDIDEDLANKASESIKLNGGTCRVMAGDASNIDFIEKMVRDVVSEQKRLDMVVANAGITLFGDFLSYPRESFQKVLDTNLRGTFFLAQASANHMKNQEEGGSILFISSVTGHQAHKNLAAYGMSKAAIEMLAKSLVIDLSPLKININTLAPGATLTERTQSDREYEKTWRELTPMGRPAYSTDIAHAALFFLSEKAKHITGQTLIIDGGWTSISPSPY